jgi:hypothetical protein
MAKRTDSKIKDLIAAAGVLMTLILAFVNGLRNRGVTGEAVYRLATPEGEGLLAQILDAVSVILKPGGEKVTGLVRREFDWSLLDSDWSVVEEVTLENPATVLDPEKFRIEMCMKPGEGCHFGEDRLLRLQELDDCRPADLGVFAALWGEEGHETLEYLYKKFGVTYLDFFGTILRDSDGYRDVLYLYRDGDGRWSWYSGWLAHEWGAGAHSLVLAK